MNNNTKVRIRLTKQLFESLNREVMLEAKNGGMSHAQKLTQKMPRLGENKDLLKAKKKKKEDVKKKVMEIAKKQLAEMKKVKK